MLVSSEIEIEGKTLGSSSRRGMLLCDTDPAIRHPMPNPTTKVALWEMIMSK
jgi:hypothetical protein